LLGIVFGSIAVGAVAFGTIVSASPARSEALLLVDADTGKILRAENATYPWYPASVTKLMTLYVTLSAVRDHRITFDTMFAVSPNAAAQSPTKMGFPVGTQVTVDNAIKMMMVKSANDMAVLLAEGIGGSIDEFAQEMTDTAHRLGMTESNFVNPNGLPADGQITSARDLAMLARALIRDFPDYSFYWHIPAIKFGRRIVRNYNPLIGRYPGADGMKTGFICASGFNLVATATRDNKQLIAVVLGAPSSAARAVKAAEMLESGFSQNPLSWLMPQLGTVDALVSMDTSPPNLKDEMCGRHRKRPATDDEDADSGSGSDNGGVNSSQFSVLLSALRAPSLKNANLLFDAGPVTPIVVYTGPTRTPAQLANLTTELAADPGRKKAKHKATAAQHADIKAAVAKPADGKPAVAKPDSKAVASKTADGKAVASKTAAGKAKEGKAGAAPWTPMSSSTLAASPPPDLKADAPADTPKPPAKPKPPAPSNFPQ
jgi:D-alanyl-D-alanine carboxypeptidase